MTRSTSLIIFFCCLSLSYCQNQNYINEDYELPPQRQQYRPASKPTIQDQGPRPTPVPILKQINRHNEDGSYTYGYEGADGSFKIETKLPTGEVMGKYGYVDDSGKVRIVEYGANKFGFQPEGEGITVPPPTLVDETTRKTVKQNGRGSFIDDEYTYEEEPEYVQPIPQTIPRRQQQQVQHTFTYEEPIVRQAPRLPSRPISVQQSNGPAPPRAIISGAAPVSSSRPIFNPAPVHEETNQQPSYQSNFQRDFVPRPPPTNINFSPIPQPSRTNYARSSSSILDQLEKDYALPQGAPSYHDISFGSY